MVKYLYLFHVDATLMERLLQYSHYKNDGGYNSKFITKLVRNFRSHPELLTVPNKLFYEDELEVSQEPFFFPF